MFKGNTFDIIESEPERLAEVKGISLKKAMDIAVQFQEKQEMRHAMMFLSEYGITSRFAVRIFEEYGNKMYDILKTNPINWQKILRELVSGQRMRLRQRLV